MLMYTREGTTIVRQQEKVKNETWQQMNNLFLNSSLMMSLGAGALKVSRGPNAISRGEVSMATLEAGTIPRAATNRHCHTE